MEHRTESVGTHSSTASEGKTGSQSPGLESLRQLISYVSGCLVVMRAALPDEHTQLTEREASLYQVSARALQESLQEAAQLAGSEVGATVRVSDLLMFAENLLALVEAALWQVCVGDAEVPLTSGQLAGTCALIERRLVETLALLRGSAVEAEGGAS